MTERRAEIAKQAAAYLLTQLLSEPPKPFVDAVATMLEQQAPADGSTVSVGTIVGGGAVYPKLTITFRRSFTDLATDFAQVLHEFGATDDDYRDFVEKLERKWAELPNIKKGNAT